MAFGTYTRSSSPAGSPTGYEPAYGGIPNLPPYAKDTTTVTGTDVQANIERNLPNYMAMVGADVGNIGSNLAGVLSPDVIRELQQQAAERGIATGSPGSPNTDAAYLRALGLTSLQLQQLGHTQLNQAIARTPIQQMQTTDVLRDLGPERAIYAAAPVPGAAARQAILDAQMGAQYGARGVGRGYSPMSITGYPGPQPLASRGVAPSTNYGGFIAGGGRTGYFDDTPKDPYAELRSFPTSYQAERDINPMLYTGPYMTPDQTQAMQDYIGMTSDLYGFGEGE